MILTEKEIEALRNYCREIDPRDVEAAVIATLSKGVSVEPRKCKKQSHGFKWVTYEAITLDQLQTAIAAARVQTINECADILAEYDCLNSGMGREIRALIGAKT